MDRYHPQLKRPLTQGLLAALLVLAVGFSSISLALDYKTARENELKAAFLSNFSSFIKWPESTFSNTDEKLIITVLGHNPFGTTLQQLVNGKPAQGRAIEVRHIDWFQTLEPCHILFISDVDSLKVRQRIRVAAAFPAVVVGDSSDFLELGGMIKFTVDSNTLAFEVHQTAAEQAGLKLQAKLLRLAKEVY